MNRKTLNISELCILIKNESTEYVLDVKLGKNLLKIITMKGDTFNCRPLQFFNEFIQKCHYTQDVSLENLYLTGIFVSDFFGLLRNQKKSGHKKTITIINCQLQRIESSFIKNCFSFGKEPKTNLIDFHIHEFNKVIILFNPDTNINLNNYIPNGNRGITKFKLNFEAILEGIEKKFIKLLHLPVTFYTLASEELRKKILPLLEVSVQNMNDINLDEYNDFEKDSAIFQNIYERFSKNNSFDQENLSEEINQTENFQREQQSKTYFSSSNSGVLNEINQASNYHKCYFQRSKFFAPNSAGEGYYYRGYNLPFPTYANHPYADFSTESSTGLEIFMKNFSRRIYPSEKLSNEPSFTPGLRFSRFFNYY